MTKPHRIIAAIIAILIAWNSIDSDIESACNGNQACLAASL